MLINVQNCHTNIYMYCATECREVPLSFGDYMTRSFQSWVEWTMGLCLKGEGGRNGGAQKKKKKHDCQPKNRYHMHVCIRGDNSLPLARGQPSSCSAHAKQRLWFPPPPPIPTPHRHKVTVGRCSMHGVVACPSTVGDLFAWLEHADSNQSRYSMNS